MLELPEIEFDKYQNACLKFAKDSQEWRGMQSGYFYTNNGSDWLETCDNSHGGFDLRWCFHLDKRDIKRRCKNEYIKIIRENIDGVLDADDLEDWTQEETKQYMEWLFNTLYIE